MAAEDHGAVHRAVQGSVDPMLPSAARIIEAHAENPDTFTLTLDTSDLAEPFRFEPGQFCMLYAFGAGEVPISISGDPESRAGLVHTIRAVGSVTRAMQKLKAGDFMGIRGPFGTSWPVREASGRDLVIVGGGIGLAPLRPLIYHVLRHRSAFRKVQLFYGARSPEDRIFLDELDGWGREPDIDLFVTVDHGMPGWPGNVGVVTDLLPQFDGEPDRAVAVLCGPEIMMRFAVRKLNSIGIRNEQIYVSMERNMHCAVGFCGHCQFGPEFICKDGPVFRFDRILPFFTVREL